MHVSGQLFIDEVAQNLVSLQVNSITGLPAGLYCDQSTLPQTLSAQETDQSTECFNLIGIPEESGIYLLTVNCTAIIDVLGYEIQIDGVELSHSIVIEETSSEILGCTYSDANNYNQFANSDDGSCVFALTDDDFDAQVFCGEGTQWVDSLQACMVTEAALMQSCGEGTYWDEEAQACLTTVTCAEDLNTDGIVGIADLLQLLSMFGTPCDEVETSEFSCGDPMNYHGYDYATVQIGEQCWFAENLRTELYQNGDSISSGLDNDLWEQATSGALAYYGEGSSSCTHWVANINACDPDQYLTEFGILYNWYAVDDPRNICPAQWSTPSEFDWNTLSAHAQSIDSINPSSLLKSHSGWHSEPGDYGNGIDYFGFNGLPSGRRYWLGWFGGAGLFAPWWTSDEAELNSDYARSFQLHTSYATVNDGDYNKNGGRPIRCIKDTE